MSKRYTTAEDYAAFFGRIEDEFDPEEMTKADLTKWLRNDSLADTFSLTRQIWLQIDNVNNFKDLQELQTQARKLLVHRNKVLRKIREKYDELVIKKRERDIARGIAQVESFAKEKKINLGDRAIGRVENWKKFTKKKLVIRNRLGRFISWKDK